MTISYVLNEEHANEITRQFIEYYDHDYWYYKLQTNHFVLENLAEFREQFGDEELRGKPIEEHRLALESEVAYSFFHGSEAVFSLFMSIWVEIPWLRMKHIGYGQICNFIRDQLLKDEITNTDIVKAFYFNVDAEPALEHDEDFTDSVEFISNYLKNIGARMLDNDAYRAYKHGLRQISRRESLDMFVEDDDSGIESMVSEDGNAITYIESEKFHEEGESGKDEYHQVVEVTEWFEYDLYYRLCTINYQLIEQMFDALQQV